MTDRYMFKIRMNTLGRQYTEIKPCFVETAFRIYVKTAGIVRRSDVYRYLKYSAISFILSDCFTRMDICRHSGRSVCSRRR